MTRALRGLLAALLLGCVEAATALAAGEALRPFSPAGLGVQILATDPAAPGTLYISRTSLAAGLFKSADGGRTWSWSGRGLEGQSLPVLVTDPSRPGTLYALGGESALNLFESTDGGASWRRRSLPPLEDPRPAARDLVIGGSGELYAALDHTLAASFDRGVTWTVLLKREALIQGLAVDRTAPGTLYVATSAVAARGALIPAQLLATVDGGRTWKEIGGDVLPPTLGGRLGLGTVFLGVAATRPATLYAGIAGQGIFQSTDGGASWRQLPLGQPLDLDLKALLLDPSNPAALYAAYGSKPGRVAVSGDSGATWRSWDQGGLDMGVTALAADPSTGVLYGAGLMGGLHSSSQGKAWSPLIRSPHESPGFVSFTGKVRFRPGDPSTVYTLFAGQLWKSLDGGKTWTASAVGPGAPFLNDLAFDSAHPDVLYGATGNGIFRSGDGGTRWVRIGGMAARALVLPRPGSILAAGCGIARSSDGGATWQQVFPCQEPGRTDQRSVETLWVHPAAPDEILATVRSVQPGGYARSVYRSLDGGATWQQPVTGAGVLARDPSHPRRLYVTRGDQLLTSTDGGWTWSPLGSLGDAGEVSDLVVDPASPNTLYAVTLWGLRRSLDGGRTWEPLGPELSGLQVSALLPHPTVPHLFYEVASNGIQEVRLEPPPRE